MLEPTLQFEPSLVQNCFFRNHLCSRNTTRRIECEQMNPGVKRVVDRRTLQVLLVVTIIGQPSQPNRSGTQEDLTLWIVAHSQHCSSALLWYRAAPGSR